MYGIFSSSVFTTLVMHIAFISCINSILDLVGNFTVFSNVAFKVNLQFSFLVFAGFGSNLTTVLYPGFVPAESVSWMLLS